MLFILIASGALALPATQAHDKQQALIPARHRRVAVLPGKNSQEPAVVLEPHTMLYGGVAMTAGADPVAGCIERLTIEAFKYNAQMRELDSAVTRHRTVAKKIGAWARDAANWIVFYRGDALSSEAGDVILDEKLKVKNRSSAEYLRQRLGDEISLDVTAGVLQLAAGLGTSDREHGVEQIKAALSDLERLVGAQAAEQALKELARWSKQLRVPESAYMQRSWSIAQRRDKVKSIMQASIKTDPVIQEIKDRVHKYNQRSRLMLATSRLVKTTLELAALTPSLVSPAAQAAEFVYIMATGGPEEDKLLRELYLDKRLASRSRSINEKAHLALDNYQLACLTRNSLLLACSEALIRQMAGPEAVIEVLGRPCLVNDDGTAPHVMQHMPAHLGPLPFDRQPSDGGSAANGRQPSGQPANGKAPG